MQNVASREPVGFCIRMFVTVFFTAEGFVGQWLLAVEVFFSCESYCYYLPGIELQAAGFSI